MPFDGTDFQPPPKQPRGNAPSGHALSVIIVAGAVFLLVMPFSLAAFVDIVRYLHTH